MSTDTATQETREFQAEVKKMLDIVIHSLYTEREIFLRELISNAADALEKFRHQKVASQGEEIFDDHLPLEIKIKVDQEKHTLTITDTGIGMDRGELEHNLGTIAHSGSRTFLANLTENQRQDTQLIGQFGVGFYAAFMAADKVRVQSRSFRPDDAGHEWVSDGTGTYTIGPCPGIRRGTRIILHLKEDAKEFADEERIKQIIRRYSSFVPFPIKVAEEPVNTVQAIWTRNKSEIKEEEYQEFYKYIANAFDEPLARLHFSADAPLAVKALLFFPKENVERLGFGRLEPGVNLYCQRVLIEQHSKNILPEWLRFVKGVIDSEDLPLNISRQALQDSALVAKINRVISKRLLKYLAELAKNEPETYEKFWHSFGMFLKEGAISDFNYRKELAGLLRFESSKTEPGKLTSLAEYVGRMAEAQKDIYYISGPSREAVETGPYLEAFKSRDLEVLYTLDPMDDFALNHIGEFEEHKLVSADRDDLDLGELGHEQEAERQDAAQAAKETLPPEEAKELTAWIKEVLGEKVKEVKASKRLTDSPAMVVNPDGFLTSSMERVMRASGQQLPDFGGKNLEINPGHGLISGLNRLRQSDAELARQITEQIYDNAMIQAGLLSEPRTMVNRNYEILTRLVGK
ncbi:molecular chaperone HtpG [Desulfurivibrio alkaliphilus]|uniref:Chaperone protein HtpG n=1 Tax=Desulfurivibrio alkaliphilus (strain DSM 19089 / UNIQEM U267 / AHT2) TaxID=589865 RepID=D6Z0T5_DESAT|nr:molecular chaperone HtpG [Desulfurivibrio alkaliphilus]ADH87195.1 Heat shock protein Hsp90-like protein [Desulfurivibrio alkaliphilus AHT 2]